MIRLRHLPTSIRNVARRPNRTNSASGAESNPDTALSAEGAAPAQAGHKPPPSDDTGQFFERVQTMHDARTIGAVVRQKNSNARSKMGVLHPRRIRAEALHTLGVCSSAKRSYQIFAVLADLGVIDPHTQLIRMVVSSAALRSLLEANQSPHSTNLDDKELEGTSRYLRAVQRNFFEYARHYERVPAHYRQWFWEIKGLVNAQTSERLSQFFVDEGVLHPDLSAKDASLLNENLLEKLVLMAPFLDRHKAQSIVLLAQECLFDALPTYHQDAEAEAVPKYRP